MTSKTELQNSGIPLYVDPAADLPAQPGALMDSWYVTCNFEFDGRQLGFEWHQQIATAEGVKTSQVEFLVMDGTRFIWIDNAQNGVVGEGLGASSEKCEVFSRFGKLSGDIDGLTLRLVSDRASVHVHLTPQQQVLYNGTTGLLEFMGTDSQEYAFPNMVVEGELIIEGQSIPVHNVTAWFDRQWSLTSNPILNTDKSSHSLPSWLWIGMTLHDDNTGALSLWDVIAKGKRNGFATIIGKNGVQANHTSTLKYGDIWQSESTGNRYPSTFEVSIPTAELELSFEALIPEPEFDHGSESISGCQSICRVRGKYGNEIIDRHVIVEMIGDICGEV